MVFTMSGILAVLSMTLFSWLIGLLTANNFSEPSLLSQILKRLFGNNSSGNYYVYAWIMHFAIGFSFLGIYELLWWILGVDKSLGWIILFGIISGILGVLGWNIMFASVHFNSNFNFKLYYFQLVIAHIIFSLVAVNTFTYLNEVVL